ncbi:hypothetical protein XENTR_v10000355 [Xenopus tropicalis]|nr:hypothetical protein XENTR_v10000355 [Xenopus tropicalis]
MARSPQVKTEVPAAAFLFSEHVCNLILSPVLSYTCPPANQKWICQRGWGRRKKTHMQYEARRERKGEYLFKDGCLLKKTSVTE